MTETKQKGSPDEIARLKQRAARGVNDFLDDPFGWVIGAAIVLFILSMILPFFRSALAAFWQSLVG